MGTPELTAAHGEAGVVADLDLDVADVALVRPQVRGMAGRAYGAGDGLGSDIRVDDNAGGAGPHAGRLCFYGCGRKQSRRDGADDAMQHERPPFEPYLVQSSAMAARASLNGVSDMSDPDSP
jgi:hypothetical protein